MERAEVISTQPRDDEAAQPARRFVIVVGKPASDVPVSRIEDPPRLLRLWLVLQATVEQLDNTTLPPERLAGLQRQLRVIRHELERAVSPPLTAEIRQIVPPHEGEPSADALRIEYAALAGWVGGLVLQMLAVFIAARERAEQGSDVAEREDRP
jgi:hypothetical protein